MQQLQSLKINNKVNPPQLRAITHGAGAACVIAGPGSGKTFVIIQRVINLIESGVSPGQILVITFTKAAAIEMQQRFIKETDSRFPEVLFGTFHSCFYQILKSSTPAGTEPVTVMSNLDKYNCMSSVLRQLQSRIRQIRKSSLYSKKGIYKEKDRNGFINNNADLGNSCGNGIPEEIDFDNETIKVLLSEVSRIKNDGCGPEACGRDVPLYEHFTEIFNEYNSLMRGQSLIDFDDMILMCYELLKNNRNVLSIWQERFKYILIDEYQDINNMQFKVIELLAGSSGNVFAVGDDDQSIYGFRGSKPELMLGFKDFFPDSKEIILNVNYRCASKILEKSLLVINENRKRFVKDISPAPNSIEGVVVGKSFESKDEEYSYIAKVISTKEASNLSFKDIAVIFRTNLEATSMAQFLISKGIPCSYKEKITFIHDRKEIMDLIAYMSFVNNGNRRSDFLRIINQPVRYIKRDALKNEIVREADLLAYYKNTANIHMMDTISKLFRDLKMIGSLRPRLAVHYIRKVVGYDKYIMDKYRKDKSRMAETLAALDEFMDMCREYESFNELKDVIEEQNRIKEEAKDIVQKKNGVNIMTMHASKGLEFDTVFIPDINEGIVPSRKSVSPDAIEEERRMFYVAMTRAKKELYLTYVKGTKDNPVMMSSFLRPIRDVFD